MEESKLKVEPKIEASWKSVLGEEFQKPYFLELKEFLIKERETYTIFPPGNLIFNAFNTTPFDKVKVVLIGQDPYHGAGQAEGLSFSVPESVKAPPSLINIYKELKDDLGLAPPRHGHLLQWAEQGVLLLNSVLTVRSGQPGSHRNHGWEIFTNEAIQQLSAKRDHLVFFLWGKYAQEKEPLIDGSRHLILKAAHPSPYSAAAGFFGCKHFSKANKFLAEHGQSPIDWQLR